MASNLGCIGLAVNGKDEFVKLVDAALQEATLIGRRDGFEVWRWQDPSGARLVLGVAAEELSDLLPSCAGTPGALLDDVCLVNDDVATANVVDDTGTQVTAMAVEIEQRRLLPADPVRGPASVIALGIEVSVFDDADSFAASPASLLDPDAAVEDSGSQEPGTQEPGTQEPGAQDLGTQASGTPDSGTPDSGTPDDGVRGAGDAAYVGGESDEPVRVAAESFISYGLFGPAADAQAYAWLAGTVLSAQRRRVALTGQEFQTVRVRTAGFEADVCVAVTDHPDLPAPGQVVAGTVFLVASLDQVDDPA